ncbi:MAG: hypothetical protein J0I77_17665 [Rudaea sp.]|uniref:hypothetical protein n=1 Tax=unclassified Rudaea TaxID=2627037 RepID=UPI0010F5D7B4|nr:MULTISPECIES: hypothetical protein [unclassified Rudaea]MBN8887556.1 hypothetical protein [Rudaea sp.]
MDVLMELAATSEQIAKQIATLAAKSRAEAIVIRALAYAAQHNPDFTRYLIDGLARKDVEYVLQGMPDESVTSFENSLKELLPDQFHQHVLPSLIGLKPMN